MNTYIERVLHYTLDDGDYYPLLQFCNNAAVNLMISFPDIIRGPGGELIPFEERKTDVPGTVQADKKFFGSRATGLEVTICHVIMKEGGENTSTDSITVETYGIPERNSVLVKSIREAGESRHSRHVELHLTAPQMKAAALIELFRTAFSTAEPDDEKICSIKKDTLMKLDRGEWESSAEGAEYILYYRPDDPEALIILGSVYVAEGDWRNGRKKLLKALDIHPENPDAWYKLGLAYMKGSDNGSALHCFDKALVYDPENHGAYFMKGVILEETGRSDEAVEAYRYAVKYSPGTHKARMCTDAFFTKQSIEALERLGSPWRGDEELPAPEGADINEDLVRAASDGDVKKIGRLLKKGGAPDYRSHEKLMHGRTPLIAAALNGHVSAVKYLLEHGAGIDSADESGCTPLGSVVEWGGDPEIIRLLVERGADVNGKDPYGRPLVLNERVLADSVILHIFADAGAELNTADENGENGVYSAAAAGNRESVLFFIEHGADINCRTRSGATPVMAAAFKMDHEMLRLLLERGGNPDLPDREGRTPLMVAAENSDPDSAAMLIGAGADVNTRDNLGRSAVDIMLESGRKGDMEAYRKCMDLLSDAGAELLRNKKES